jgi:hypothetical protein
MMFSHRQLVLLRGFVAFPLLAQAANAQTIRGSLIDSLTSQPIDNAFVVLRDSNSIEVTRSITNGRGGFSLAAPGPGAYVLRTERIGFGSTEAYLGYLDSAETREVTVRVNPIVIRLGAITVAGDSNECRVHGEQGLATATVWEEARKVLAAVVWGESQRFFTYHTRKYSRRLNRWQSVERETDSLFIGNRVVLFRSRAAQELQEHGYAVIRPDSFFYYAPDAATFFSDAFLSQHCFNLHRDDEHPGLIGLRFEPIRGRTIPDVQGVLWLDEGSAELRFLELRYTNLGSRLLDEHAEGMVEFDRLPGGPWFVSGWWIRMPIISRAPPDLWLGQLWPRDVLIGYDEDGGEVQLVVDDNRVVVFDRSARR